MGAATDASGMTAECWSVRVRWAAPSLLEILMAMAGRLRRHTQPATGRGPRRRTLRLVHSHRREGRWLDITIRDPRAGAARIAAWTTSEAHTAATSRSGAEAWTTAGISTRTNPGRPGIAGAGATRSATGHRQTC